MLHYSAIPKHKSRRKIKKYSRSRLRKDIVFRGIKVFTYDIDSNTLFTAKPKQKRSKSFPYKWVLWLNALKLK